MRYLHLQKSEWPNNVFMTKNMLDVGLNFGPLACQTDMLPRAAITMYQFSVP